MAVTAKDVSSNTALKQKIEKSLGKPVLFMMEVPMSAAEQNLVKSANLKDGDLLNSLIMGGVHAHSWSCTVSGGSGGWDCTVDGD